MMYTHRRRCCAKWTMVGEMRQRHERFLRELVRAQLRMDPSGSTQRGASSAASQDPQDNVQHFPGATALIFQAEHVHRTHDIPCSEFRPDSLFHYLVGDALLGAPEPLVPIGLGGTTRLAQRGGATTCAMLHVRQRHDDDPVRRDVTPCGSHGDRDAALPLRCYDTFVDVFCADASIAPERSLWHDDTTPLGDAHRQLFGTGGTQSDDRRGSGLEAGDNADLLSLFASDDTVVSRRFHDNAASTVVQRFWAHTQEAVRLSAERAVRQRTTDSRVAAASIEAPPSREIASVASVTGPNAEVARKAAARVVREHDLPLLALSLPMCRSTKSIAGSAQHLLDGWGVEAATLAASELEALKRLQVAHPVTAVLAGVLLFRSQVPFPQEGLSLSSPCALLQYAVRDAGHWALPAAWPSELLQPVATCGERVGEKVSSPHAHDAFVRVHDAKDAAVDASGGGSKRQPPRSLAFRRRRDAIDARRLFDRIRCIKTPHDASMLYRSAIATAQSFAGGMRAVVSAAQPTLAASSATCNERDVLRAMQSAAWAARVVHPHLAIAVPSHAFGYPPVVAAGQHALAVHYTHCNAVVGAEAWVLVDAGVELNGIYPTDCTRCWPAGATAVRRFLAEPHADPSPQAVVYDAVLGCQRKLLQQMRAGLPRATLHTESKRLLTDAVGLLRRRFDGEKGGGGGWVQGASSISPAVVDAVSLHAVGHYLGFDIHEKGPPPMPTTMRFGQGGCGATPWHSEGAAGEPRFLGGTMHTIEPGLYLRGHDDPMLPALLHAHSVANEAEYTSTIPRLLGGIGMRVEDSVLVLPPLEAGLDGGGGHRSLTGHSRADYLNALLSAFADHNLPVHDASWSIQALRGSFVQQQTQSIWGGEQPSCLAAASRHVEGDDSDASWYPFDVVVLTACVPKDLCAIRRAMTGL